MYQHGRDVYAIRTGHAVLAVVARDGGVLIHQVGRLLQKLKILVGQWHERGVSAQVVLQVLHVGHSTQYGEHIGERACKTESPGGHAGFGIALLDSCH